MGTKKHPKEDGSTAITVNGRFAGTLPSGKSKGGSADLTIDSNPASTDPTVSQELSPNPAVPVEEAYQQYVNMTAEPTIEPAVEELAPPVSLSDIGGITRVAKWHGGKLKTLPSLSFNSEDSIQKLLEGRRIVNVDTSTDTITLDTGRELQFEANEGCGGCPSGGYWISHLGQVDNVITKVSFGYDYEERGPEESDLTRYEIFVYTGNEQINLLTVEGNDGNGYYGTGYRIVIVEPEETETTS